VHTYEFMVEPEVEEFIAELEKKKNRGDKAAKVMWDKIQYIRQRVRLQGTRAGAKFIKSLKGKENDNLYEIRSIDKRIFMCLWNGNHFVMLSHYTKDDNETDTLELAKARRLRDQYMKDHPAPNDK
jgi:mRNA-degrading endonuclease RelE of RelBE toxin-antitoxin system